MRRRRHLPVALSLVLLALLSSGCGEDAREISVVTGQGELVGVAADGVRSFRAIPYAAPPVGARDRVPVTGAPRVDAARRERGPREERERATGRAACRWVVPAQPLSLERGRRASVGEFARAVEPPSSVAGRLRYGDRRVLSRESRR